MRLSIPSLLCCLLLLASPAWAAAKRSPALETLRTQCLLQSADPKNPWALAHGMTAFGKDFAAADGRRAADVIIADYLRKTTDKTATTYSFAAYAQDRTPIEPHPNLLIKTLVLAGFSPGTKFKASFGEVTLQQLVDGVKNGFRHVPQSDEYWRQVGWTLDLLASSLKPGPAAVFTNGAGEQIDFNKVMDDAFDALQRHEGDLYTAMDKQQASVPKRKQGIYSHSCGGMHLTQAVMNWARYPEVKKKWAERINREVKLLFWRLGSEQPQYEAAYQQALSEAPEFKITILTQMVKFHGHLLETLGRMKADKVYTFSKDEQLLISKSQAMLDHAVRQLQEAKAFESMDALKKSQYQTYLDLIGDSCHAAHGLELWR